MQDRISQMKKRMITCFLAFAGTVLVMLFLFVILGYTPFGNNTMANSDARIQYLDFFSFYKDVLAGKNRIDYTFSSGLGANTIGIFSYYLASPLNLLVVFFKKSQMSLFLDMLITLKLGLCAFSFAYYAQSRFEDKLRRLIVVMLSIGYGLMQYNISRGSNIMWLDGVIMLPWILLGAWKVVRGRRIAPLTIPVGMSILFNWYTGGINCLYCILFFAFEYLLAEAQGQAVYPFSGSPGRKGPAGAVIRFLTTVLRYGVAMAAGVCISAVLFLPSVDNMSYGKGGEFYLDLYMRNEMNGNPLDTLMAYFIGMLSSRDKVALFCGSAALIGTFAFFLCRRIRIREKVLGGAILLVTVLTYYWQPLFFAFSLFKRVDSYFFRYGYLGSFVLLFLAAWYFTTLPGISEADCEDVRKSEIFLPLFCSILYIVLSVVLFKRPLLSPFRIRETNLCMAGTGLLLTWIALTFGKGKEDSKGSFRNRIPVILLVCICLFELGRNAQLLMKIFHSDDADVFVSYAEGAQKQADALKEYDSSFYRVSQTSTRDMNTFGIGAAYNDAMAYGFNGIGGYTSCPENNQLYLLDRLGYVEQGVCLNVINTSFLPSDAFLGVKYVLSAREIAGLIPVDGIGEQNKKTVYENPYVLPMAFVYDGTMLPSHSYEDPFSYVEEIYTALSGEEARLFTPLSSSMTYDRYSMTWEVTIPEGTESVYGNLPWDVENEGGMGALIRTGGNTIGYQKWLGPTVFDIPLTGEEETVSVRMSGQNLRQVFEEQFYSLDLDRLAELSRIIRDKAASVHDLSIENGRIRCTVDAHEGDYLYLSVSTTSGWKVRVNGEKAYWDEFGYCMMIIPLQEGENIVEMDFVVPYLRRGILVTGIGLMFLVLRDLVVWWIGKRRERRQ